MAFAKKTVSKNDELFNINGLSIKKEAVYKIQNRPDPNAPAKDYENRTAKIPSTNVGNTFDAPFEVTNANTGSGVWNTGLYEMSPCYKGEDPKIVSEKIKNIKINVIEPFEKLKGKVGILEHYNDEFWNDYRVEVWDGKYLNTANPEHLLELCIAMVAGELAPEGDQGNPRYNQADFIVVDKAKERNLKQKKAVSNIDAIGNFYVLLSENAQKLKAILRYIGVANMTDTIDSVTIKTMFNTWLDSSPKNADTFGRILEKCESNKSFEESVYLYSTLKKAMEKGKINKNSIGDYTYNGIPLGKDLKIVSENLIINSELSDVKAQILEEQQ